MIRRGRPNRISLTSPNLARRGASGPRTKLRAPMMSWPYLLLCATLATAKSPLGPRAEGGVAKGGPGVSDRLDGAAKRQNDALISPSETNRFAGNAVSHWNPYERRIRHSPDCVFSKA